MTAVILNSGTSGTPTPSTKRAANVLIVQLGDAAPTHAEICHSQLLADGDLSGVAFWKRIIGALGFGRNRDSSAAPSQGAGS